jgi:hypothetical protein
MDMLLGLLKKQNKDRTVKTKENIGKSVKAKEKAQGRGRE